MRKRPAGVVNAHLWEFPNAELFGNSVSPREIARRILTVMPTTIQPLCVIKHTITRYRITVEAHQVRVKRQPMKPIGSGHWLTLDEVELLPLTSAHRKILRIKLETGQV